MKIKFTILFTIILAALSGCKDNEPDLRMPLTDIIGIWNDDFVHITLNGKEYVKKSYHAYNLTEIMVEGEFDETQKEGKFILVSLALQFFDEERRGAITNRCIGVWIDCKSVAKDKIIFSGKTYIPVTGFDIEVEGMVTGEGDHRYIYLDINYRQHSDILIGRTFEIDFTDGSAYPEFSADVENAGIVEVEGWPDFKPMPASDYIQLAFDKINDTYCSKLGYDKARIRFNDDLSYSLWFRDAASGEYILSDSDLHYYYNDSILYFIDPFDFVRSFVPYFDFWGELEYGKMFHLHDIEYNRKNYTVFGLDYEIEGDKLILTHRSYWNMAPDFCGGLLMPWPWYKLAELYKYYTPKAVFTEVK